jgi:CPA1 family monovalent cation:H+ antiporter
MLEIGIFVLLVAFVSQLIQEKLKIAASITAITVGLVMNVMGLGGIISGDKMFDQILLLLLPSLLLMDILHLKLKDLKKHALSLFYVAGVSVLLSVGAGVLMNSFIFPDYNISIPAIVMLFCMVSATDPVAVSAVFSNYKIPHDLKVLCEGESLFNDATNLVFFSLGLMFITAAVEPTALEMSFKAFKIIFLALLIGGVFGALGLWLLSLTTNKNTETAIILFTAFGSFYAAEYFHYSGIIAVITSVLIANHIITSRIEKYEEQDELESNPEEKRRLFVSKSNQESIFSNVQFIAMLGVTVLFLSMGDIVNFSNIIKYWKEVLYVFVASSVIRVVMMMKFSALSNVTHKMQNISFHWYLILVFAGVKGGLSILMLHLMPSTFIHTEMFEAIVIGVILLSTFVYPSMLTLTMNIHKSKFEKDCLAD